MTDQVLLNEKDYKTISDMLPKHPPLVIGGGDASIRDLCPSLSPDELDKVYEIYKRDGGTMRKF